MSRTYRHTLIICSLGLTFGTIIFECFWIGRIVKHFRFDPSGRPPRLVSRYRIDESYAEMAGRARKNFRDGTPDPADDLVKGYGNVAIPVFYREIKEGKAVYSRTGESFHVPGDLSLPLDWNAIRSVKPGSGRGKPAGWCPYPQQIALRPELEKARDGRPRYMMCYEASWVLRMYDELRAHGVVTPWPQKEWNGQKPLPKGE